jgi:hypothetical protein
MTETTSHRFGHVALDPDHGTDVGDAAFVFEAFDLDRNRIRQLGRIAQHELLADELGCEKALAAVGHFVFAVCRAPFGKPRDEVVE